MHKLVAFTLWTCLGIHAACAAENLRSKIDALAQPLVDEGIVVGLVVGVVNDGAVEFFAYGETTKGGGVRPAADTVYEIGSATKALTGSLLAAMVQAGEVKHDDPVQGLLPDSVTMPSIDGQPITLEHLATHTSGLPRLPDNLRPQDPENPYADYSEEALYEFLNDLELKRPPGQGEYSNLGMGLLGHILARRADKSYEALLAERITVPLEMKDTSITLREDQRSRLAPGYDAALASAKNWDLPTLAGAGAVRSTAADMLRYLQAHLTEADDPLAASLKAALEKRCDLDGGLSIGLGWHIAGDGVTRWHNGMTGGYASWMALVPQRKLGIVVLSNTATMKVTEVGELMTRAALGDAVEPPRLRKAITVPAEVLQRYVGEYRIVPLFGLTVTLEEGQLMVQATGQDKFPVFAETETEFFYRVVDAQLTFVADDDGAVNKLILHQNGRDLPAIRVK